MRCLRDGNDNALLRLQFLARVSILKPFVCPQAGPFGWGSRPKVALPKVVAEACQ